MEELIIEEQDFRMIHCGANFWDLELLHTIRPKGQPQRQEFKNVGYGMTIERCFKMIINYRLKRKRSDPYSMKEYLKEYKDEVKKIEHLFKDF